MRESLEVRVPMLDEELFAFGLSLPHDLKVKGQTYKGFYARLQELASPRSGQQTKAGFEIPVDSWVQADFKMRLRDALLGPSSRLPEFFWPEAYRPMVEAFCEGVPVPVSLGKDSINGLLCCPCIWSATVADKADNSTTYLFT